MADNQMNTYFVETAGVAVKRGRGGRRPGAGRKPTGPTGEAMVEVKVFLDADTLAWLEKWNSGNRSDSVRQVLERGRKMWPKGV